LRSFEIFFHEKIAQANEAEKSLYLERNFSYKEFFLKYHKYKNTDIFKTNRQTAYQENNKKV